ncbi:MAG: OmpP1/FadL family transporter, partial [Planctomycetota bacterium]
MIRLSICACVFAALASQLSAQGGGIALYELGTPDSGASAAGATARAQDAGTVFWNPAGMTRIPGHELMLGLGVLIVDQELDLDFNETVPPTPGETNSGGHFGGIAPLAGTYYHYSATEDVKLGIAINGVWGGAVDYDDDWVGRLYTTNGKLQGMNIQPSVGYRVNEWASVGVGLNVVYTELELDARVSAAPGAPSVNVRDADDWAVGGTFGVLFEPSETTRVGVVFRTGVDLELDGKVRAPVPVTFNFNADFDFVRGINVGFYHDLTPELALLADAGWSDWSEFSDWGLTIGPAAGTLDRDWKDTWRGALGLQWRPHEKWTFRTGMSYDSSPIRPTKRLPDIPTGEQWRFSVGLEHAFTEAMIMGFSYT